MSGVHDDLATLREELNACESAREQPWVAHTALARVEAELSRLREAAEFAGMPAWERLWREKEGAVAEATRLREALDNGDRLLSQAGRASEAAEARCARLDADRRTAMAAAERFRVQGVQDAARCARLQEKLDESYRYRDMYGETIERQRGEIARLQQALNGIESELGSLPLDHLLPSVERRICKAWAMAREGRPDPELIPKTLAGPDTPADTCQGPDGRGCLIPHDCDGTCACAPWSRDEKAARAYGSSRAPADSQPEDGTA